MSQPYKPDFAETRVRGQWRSQHHLYRLSGNGPHLEQRCATRTRRDVIKGTLNRLSRQTSSGAYLPEIDALRFIAILLVIVMHISLYFANKFPGRSLLSPTEFSLIRLIDTFQNGVQLFFAISGFILALPFADAYQRGIPVPGIGKYLMRRITRLEPPYAIAMVSFAVIMIALRHQDTADVLTHLGASLLYAHAYIYIRGSTINFVAWSLEVEVQFYILMPLLASIYRIRANTARRVIIAGAAFASIAAQTFVFPHLSTDSQLRLWFSLACHFQYFLAGIYLADLYVTENKSFGPQGTRWDIAAAVAWPGLLGIWYWSANAKALLFPVAIVLLYVASFRGPVTNRIMRNPWICAVGGMCYSIYLIHMPLISFIGPFTSHLFWTRSLAFNLALQTVLIGPLVLFASMLFFLVIEKPCMRKDWPQKLVAWITRLSQANKVTV